MPRTARIKSEEGMYHIMIRSISEVSLFKDSEDKNKYIQLIKKYMERYHFKIYAYCLMTNHGHIIIDCCGADISQIMKSIDQSYVIYFNKKYKRNGHLFQDRFKSKLVTNNRYLLVLSAYIHNNAMDIAGYSEKVHQYEFSSLGLYLGIRKDNREIVDFMYILQHYGTEISIARKKYLEFVNSRKQNLKEIDVEFKDDKSEYRSERKVYIRNLTMDELIKFVEKYTESKIDIRFKYNHHISEVKSVCLALMRSFTGLTTKEICQRTGNVTSSNLWRLCEKGYSQITLNKKYANIVQDLIKEFSL